MNSLRLSAATVDPDRATSPFGFTSISGQGRCFVATHPRQLVRSSLRKKLVSIARSVDLNDVDSVPAISRYTLSLLDADANAFRLFPYAQLADILRDPCRFRIELSSWIMCARVTIKLWQLLGRKSARQLAPNVYLWCIACSRSKEKRAINIMRSRDVCLTVAPYLPVSCSPPSLLSAYVKKLCSYDFSCDPAERLVDAFLFHIQFSLVHPLRDGNGRVTRAYFSAISSQHLKGVFPFSLVFFMQGGGYLYKHLLNNIAHGDSSSVSVYFERSCERLKTLCREAKRNRSDFSSLMIYRQLAILQKVIRDESRTELPCDEVLKAMWETAVKLAPATYCGQ